MTEKIDFVVTWVDGADPQWLEKYNKYVQNQNDIKIEQNSESRYRDWEVFRYWFRAIEKHAPWVNNIYLIVDHQVPEWLNTENTKIKIVNHEDIIEKQYLPTFNSNAIEWNIWKIPDLSENFVYFNDDVFLNSDTTTEDFFLNNLPRDIGVLGPIIPDNNSHTVLNNVQIIDENFNKRKVLKENWNKFFNLKYGKQLIRTLSTLPWNRIYGFYDPHVAYSFKKSLWEKIYYQELEKVKKTINSKFRNNENISLWLVRYWQICTGDFVPRSYSFSQALRLEEEFDEILKVIKNKKIKVICLNDDNEVTHFEDKKKQLIETFNQKYPIKSQYEK